MSGFGGGSGGFARDIGERINQATNAVAGDQKGGTKNFIFNTGKSEFSTPTLIAVVVIAWFLLRKK